MKISTQPYKGTRDYYPQDLRLRNWIFDNWRKVCESFGYEEYDGPILEPLEIYSSKTSDEIVNEQTYSFTDRGDRKVVMRPEMTPTVSRMVAAKRQELSYPLRLYSIPNCFRYERPQRGRTREFWQLNADIFGVVGTEADFEIVSLADSIMKSFGADSSQYEIQISSRKITNDLLDELKISTDQNKKVMTLLDKKEKIDRNDWLKMLKEVLDNEKTEKLLTFLNSEEIPINAKKLIDTLKNRGITNVVFNRYLTRGFDYYTDIVFEVFDTNKENNRSMFGGGRYDSLVSQFGAEPIATVGFGMGDVPLLNFLESRNLLPELKTETEYYVTVIGENVEYAQLIANELRKQGKNIAVDYSQKKIEKQIKTAEKKGIQKVIFIGDEEVKTKKVKVKDLTTGEESALNVDIN